MLVSLRQEFSPKGFEIVGIAVDNVANIVEFVDKYKISYPILVANAEGISLMQKLGNTAGALPYTVVLDRRGAIVNRKLGILRRSEVEHQIKEML